MTSSHHLLATNPRAGKRQWRALLVAAAALAATCAQAAIPATERQALLTLYRSTQGDQWTVRTGWLGPAGSECSWTGVTCDAAGQHVVAVKLINNQLRGTLPALGALRELQVLNVALNHLRGPLPSLRGLGQLRVLKANNNLLSGPLPQLNAAPRLERLQLANNALSGSLRHGASQQALRVVDVSNNQFSGPMPSLADMPQLRRFDASFNRLSGAAPTGHHPDAVLELEGNRLHNSPPTGGS